MRLTRAHAMLNTKCQECRKRGARKTLGLPLSFKSIVEPMYVLTTGLHSTPVQHPCKSLISLHKKLNITKITLLLSSNTRTRSMHKIQKVKLNIWDYPQIRNLYPDAWLNWAFVINGGLTLWKKGERGKSRNAITHWVEINSEIQNRGSLALADFTAMFFTHAQF